MKPHYILFFILGFIALAVVAQEAETIVRYRSVDNIPAGLNSALRNTMTTLRAARTNAERTVIQITVMATATDTNINVGLSEWVPFVERQ